MPASSKRGNNPELWEKLLTALDEKLQLGLLDHLTRVSSYHFEDQTLTVQAGSKQDFDYLSRSANQQQLQILAEDATGIEKIKVERPAD